VKSNPTMNLPSTTGGTRLVALTLERQFSKKLNDRIGSEAEVRSRLAQQDGRLGGSVGQPLRTR